MNNSPQVTIIIPSYNHAQYIVKAIDSVKLQTYNNWELIVVDDGSTDNTHKILNQLPEDNRITILLNKDNRNQSVRINQAIKIAKGDYISFLSSDDWYSPKKIEQQITLFETLDETYGVVYSSGYRHYEDTKTTIEVNTKGNMRRGFILELLLREPFFIYPISPLIRKECFDYYPFDESYTAEGEAVFFKIAMKYKFDFVNEPLVTMREHTYNIGRNVDKMLKENIRYREELIGHKDFPKELKKYKGEVLGKIYKLKGWEYIRLTKEYIKGREALINAIKVDRTLLFDKRVIIGLILSLIPKKLASRLNK